MFNLELWQEIVIYIFLIISAYIFAKMSRIEINGIKLIGLKYRILLALFFPIILVLIIVFSSVILSLILTVVFVIILLSFLMKLTNKKP